MSYIADYSVTASHKLNCPLSSLARVGEPDSRLVFAHFTDLEPSYTILSASTIAPYFYS